MDYDVLDSILYGLKYLFYGIFVITIIAVVCLETRVSELENKINSNCVYINNEFYCKD